MLLVSRPCCGREPSVEKGRGAMLDIRDVFSNLFGLFLLIGVGYGTVRFRVLPASASKMLSSLLMNVTARHHLYLSGAAL